jgi:hypothetical protein
MSNPRMLICGLGVWAVLHGPPAPVAPGFSRQIPAPAGAPRAPAPNGEVVAEVANLRFHSAFWPNLHHTLYVAAWDQRPTRTREQRLAGRFPEPLTGPLTSEERAAWAGAVGYYDRELATLDLLFSDRLSGTIRKALLGSGDRPAESLDAAHRAVLEAAAPIYRKYWWPSHDRANRAWIADIAKRTEEIANDVTARLAALYQTPWFTEPVRVDVVRAGNWQGAYTMVNPAHVTISSGDDEAEGWNGVDTVFHEATHQLVLRIQRLIGEAARADHKRPGTLWHAVQFVMTGEVVREALAARKIDFVPYVYRTGLIDRAWRDFKGPIEREWMPYVRGKRTFEEAIKRLVAAI